MVLVGLVGLVVCVPLLFDVHDVALIRRLTTRCPWGRQDGCTVEIIAWSYQCRHRSGLLDLLFQERYVIDKRTKELLEATNR